MSVDEFNIRFCDQKSKACEDIRQAQEKRTFARIESLEKLNAAHQKGLVDTVNRVLTNCTDALNVHDRALADMRAAVDSKCTTMDSKVDDVLEKAKAYTDKEVSPNTKNVNNLLLWRNYVLGAVGVITFLMILFNQPIRDHFSHRGVITNDHTGSGSSKM
jgi:hypothetical protein